MRLRQGAVAALLVSITAPAALAQEFVPPIAYDVFTLDNGLQVMVHEDHSTPVVAVNVWYDVGSAHEPEGRSGFAHFFEHMMFNEMENLEKGEFTELIQAAGGSYNGTTNEDRTAYYEILPSNRINLALWLEAERMHNLVVSPTNFDREREVVKEERRRSYENRPYTGALNLVLDTLALDWAPYNHNPIGSMDDLNAATAADARQFYERFYVPNNATIAIAGDVTVEQIRALAEKYFGDIPRGPEPAPLPAMPEVPRTDGARRVVVEDDMANTPLFVKAFNIPPHGHEDTYALQLLSSIFSQGESSRLYRRLVDEEAAALGVISTLDSRVGPGIFFFAGLPNRGVEIERIEQLIEDEIAKLKADGVSARELAKAKNQMRASIIRGRLRVFSKASDLQHYRLFHGDIAEMNSELERIMAVTTEDVQAVARTYLVPANSTTVIVQPASDPTAAASTPSNTGDAIATSLELE